MVRIKTTISALFLLFFCSGWAQEWNHDLQDALKLAANSKKKVLIFFTVSDQCDNCRMLENTVFNSSQFNSFSKEEVIAVKLDFAKMGADTANEVTDRNLLIIEKYNKDGFFPLVVLLNPDGRVLGKSGIYEDEAADVYTTKLRRIISGS